MPFAPVLTATLEKGLNTFLYRDAALKSARQRLLGKVLRLDIKELRTPLVLVFSEQQLDVLAAWDGLADCTVVTQLPVLVKVRDRQQLTSLIRSGELEVTGDVQVVQNLMALLDLAEIDPAELLAPYIGDVAAEGLRKIAHAGGSLIKRTFQRHTRYMAESITEEWRLAPGPLETAWFAEDTSALERETEALNKRLEKLEAK